MTVAGYAPHPNAAKLFVAFLMGSKDLNINSVLKPPFRSGKSLDLLQGMAAFYQVGTFSPRTDVPAPPHSEMWPKAKKLTATPEFVRDNIAKISDFWMAETSRLTCSGADERVPCPKSTQRTSRNRTEATGHSGSRSRHPEGELRDSSRAIGMRQNHDAARYRWSGTGDDRAKSCFGGKTVYSSKTGTFVPPERAGARLHLPKLCALAEHEGGPEHHAGAFGGGASPRRWSRSGLPKRSRKSS